MIGEESPIAFVFLSGLGIFFLDKFHRASFLRVFYRAICRGGFSLLSFMSPYCCQSFSGNLRIAYLTRAFKTLANRSHFSNKRQKNRPSKKYSRRPAFFKLKSYFLQPHFFAHGFLATGFKAHAFLAHAFFAGAFATAAFLAGAFTAAFFGAAFFTTFFVAMILYFFGLISC